MIQASGRRERQRGFDVGLQHAERLSTLVQDNGTRIDTIGSVSEAALDNMEKLRGQLPVIASSAKDVTNTIAAAGRTDQADELAFLDHQVGVAQGLDLLAVQLIDLAEPRDQHAP